MNQTLRNFQRYLFTGFLVLGPVAVTVWLLWKSFSFLDGILASAMNLLVRRGLGITILGDRPIPGLGLITLVILLTVTGAITRRAFGKWMVVQGQLLLKRIPLVNRIYKTMDQISQAIFSGKREVFKHAVLVEFPRTGIYSIGVITSESSGKIQEYLPEECITIFVPTTPNPTTGFLLFVPRKQVIPLQIPVEDALKLILSGGALGALDEKSLPDGDQ